MQGKIIKGIGGFYYVHDGHETVYECRAKGIFRSQGIKPLVGDNVEMDILSREECLGIKSGIAVVILLVLSTLSFSGISTYVYANF